MNGKAYLVEARVCRDGHVFAVAQTATGPSMNLRDESGCDRESSVELRVQNTPGYSSAVRVSWP